jgi:hypothetical protein
MTADAGVPDPFDTSEELSRLIDFPDLSSEIPLDALGNLVLAIPVDSRGCACGAAAVAYYRETSQKEITLWCIAPSRSRVLLLEPLNAQLDFNAAHIEVLSETPCGGRFKVDGVFVRLPGSADIAVES